MHTAVLSRRTKQTDSPTDKIALCDAPVGISETIAGKPYSYIVLGPVDVTGITGKLLHDGIAISITKWFNMDNEHGRQRSASHLRRTVMATTQLTPRLPEATPTQTTGPSWVEQHEDSNPTHETQGNIAEEDQRSAAQTRHAGPVSSTPLQKLTNEHKPENSRRAPFADRLRLDADVVRVEAGRIGGLDVARRPTVLEHVFCLVFRVVHQDGLIAAIVSQDQKRLPSSGSGLPQLRVLPESGIHIFQPTKGHQDQSGPAKPSQTGSANRELFSPPVRVHPQGHQNRLLNA
ncbi:hypothetical protein FIE12Z_9507 [Fusarium flagelliforme]|uniref:Uncharacterized protein n=1 Tax=Fusarium flagelliforme TaxID=2675880 RepID=A0A395MEA0_9HYPO|nr:hypothetical protein FIE12Z_9507 [Fusarium flagelliforme]